MPSSGKSAYVKPPSTTKTIFCCGDCGQHMESKEAADKHCICKICKKRPVRRSEYPEWRRDEECEQCFLGRNLRDYGMRLKKQRGDVASTEKHIEEMRMELQTLNDAEKVGKTRRSA